MTRSRARFRLKRIWIWWTTLRGIFQASEKLRSVRAGCFRPSSAPPRPNCPLRVTPTSPSLAARAWSRVRPASGISRRPPIRYGTLGRAINCQASPRSPHARHQREQPDRRDLLPGWFGGCQCPVPGRKARHIFHLYARPQGLAHAANWKRQIGLIQTTDTVRPSHLLT